MLSNRGRQEKKLDTDKGTQRGSEKRVQSDSSRTDQKRHVGNRGDKRLRGETDRGNGEGWVEQENYNNINYNIN